MKLLNVVSNKCTHAHTYTHIHIDMKQTGLEVMGQTGQWNQDKKEDSKCHIGLTDDILIELQEAFDYSFTTSDELSDADDPIIEWIKKNLVEEGEDDTTVSSQKLNYIIKRNAESDQIDILKLKKWLSDRDIYDLKIEY